MNSWFRRHKSGFSLVEMLIVIAILTILMGLALPNFSVWTRNLQVRNAAESILTGIQKARTEALVRNTAVSFVLAGDTSWTVTQVSTAAVLEARTGADGSALVAPVLTPAAATTLTFSNIGVITNANPIQQIDLSASGGTRPLRITVGAGGVVRLCDPTQATGSRASAC